MLGLVGGFVVAAIIILFCFNANRLWGVQVGAFVPIVVASLLLLPICGLFAPKLFNGHGLFFLSLLSHLGDESSTPDASRHGETKSEIAGCLAIMLYFMGWAGMIAVTILPVSPTLGLVFIVALLLVLFPSVMGVLDTQMEEQKT